MNFFILFPFFLKHLANAEYMINSRPVASKATLPFLFFLMLNICNPLRGHIQAFEKV